MAMKRTRVLVLGAAGRDFHNFNLVYRRDPSFHVVAFTATQIPNIDGRVYPSALSGPLYPEGIPILPEDELEEIIRREAVDVAVFAYSDVSHVQVMHLASRVGAAGADFCFLGGRRTCLQAGLPVISVCAARTGCGKSQTSRKVAQLLASRGVSVAVIRHPMPYGDLARQAVQRFTTFEDLARHRCTIEEIEEYEHYLENGMAVYAGVDYEEIVRRASAESQVLVWDGGNNDTPFLRADMQVVVLDPLRPGHELKFHPGETNLRLADVLVVNKVDRASPEGLAQVDRSIRMANPKARVVRAESMIRLDDSDRVAGRRVLVVEDGPTVTHGGMSYGAGLVAAERFGARVVDPRPFATGPIARAYERYPHMGPVLPALGYYPEQLAGLEKTIKRADCELVIIGTPVDLRRHITLDKPALRVTYDLEEVDGGLTLSELIDAFLDGSKP